MGTTADKLNYAVETKRLIKEAIRSKGVSVVDSDTFRSYANKILSIEGLTSTANVANYSASVLSANTGNSKSSYLQETKRLIKEAIKTKGVAVSDTDTFRSYADKIKQIEDRSLNNYSWARIKQLKDQLGTTAFYNIFKGQTKTLTANGNSCAARLVSSHYNGAERLVFHVTGITTNYAPFANTSSQARGGWGAMQVRNTLNGTIYNSLSSDLKAVIADTTVTYSTGNGYNLLDTATSTDKLFLPSVMEYRGNSNYLYSGTERAWEVVEGTQFEWFAEDVNRIKPPSRTMTRSVPQTNRYCFIEANATNANVLWFTSATAMAFDFTV